MDKDRSQCKGSVQGPPRDARAVFPGPLTPELLTGIPKERGHGPLKPPGPVQHLADTKLLDLMLTSQLPGYWEWDHFPSKGGRLWSFETYRASGPSLNPVDTRASNTMDHRPTGH